MPRRRLASRTKLLAGALVVSTAGLALGTVGTSGGSDLRRPGGPSHATAFHVTFSVLTHGKPVPAGSLPGDLQRFLNDSARATGLSPEKASTRVHLVRSSMGRARLALYAYLDDLGRPCFYVRNGAGACATIPHTSPPDFYWLIGKVSSGSASYLVALVGDRVRAVQLRVAAENVPVSLEHNVAFAQLGQTRATSATVTVRYANGRSQSRALALR